ncbi:MAG: glycosyltransferase family 2 protein [Weeksellaceae bacterium]
MKPTITVIIPTYNGAAVIEETLQSLVRQTYQNFEIMIHDDASRDNIKSIIKKYPQISFHQNSKNLGCQDNFENARKKVRTEITYFLCQDDVLAVDALEKTYAAFQNDPQIGAVVRPFYWFDDDIDHPVRAVSQLNANKDEIITIKDYHDRIKLFFDTIGQLSGLAYRTKFLNVGFHEDVFSGHAYPFVSLLKEHPVVFLKDYVVAVRIRTSQSRTVKSIYNKSPIQSWVELCHNLLGEKKYEKLRHFLIHDFIAVNYLGLIQIKNYSTMKNLIHEIKMLLKYRKENWFNPLFWSITIGTIITPTVLLIPLTDWYKKVILAKTLPKIEFRRER